MSLEKLSYGPTALLLHALPDNIENATGWKRF